MAILPIKNATILVGGVDISGVTNMLSLEQMVETRDSTTFTTNGWRTHVGILKDASWNFSGFRQNAVDPDFMFYNPSTADPGVVLAGATNTNPPVVATITNPLVEADVAFGMRCIRQNITQGNQLGELAKYTLALKGDSPTIRGRILGTVAAAAASSATTGFELGATGATQKLYGSLHVTSISTVGDTLDVIIESDADGLFGSPTTRITFSQVLSATGTHTAQWATPISGAITDTFYRVSYTIAGSSPLFSFVVFAGIQ